MTTEAVEQPQAEEQKQEVQIEDANESGTDSASDDEVQDLEAAAQAQVPVCCSSFFVAKSKKEILIIDIDWHLLFV